MHRWLVCGWVLVALAACGGGKASSASGDDAGSDAPAAGSDAGTDDGSAPAGAPPVGLCRDGWCWVYPRPQGNVLQSIWGSSATDVWALGDHSTLLHFDGSSWKAHATDGVVWGAGGGTLWGSGPNDVWAAVTSRAGDALHWDGTSWKSTATGTFDVIGGTAANDVWAYDFHAETTLQWDGASWQSRGLPAPNWRSIAFGGATGITLTISINGGIAKRVGNAWGIIDAGSHPANAAAIVDGSHVVLAQDTGVVPRSAYGSAPSGTRRHSTTTMWTRWAEPPTATSGSCRAT